MTEKTSSSTKLSIPSVGELEKHSGKPVMLQIEIVSGSYRIPALLIVVDGPGTQTETNDAFVMKGVVVGKTTRYENVQITIPRETTEQLRDDKSPERLLVEMDYADSLQW